MTKKNRLSGLFSVLAIFAILATSCRAASPTPLLPTTTKQPTAQPTPTNSLDIVDDGSPTSPYVLKHEFELDPQAEKLRLDVAFDQPMDAAQTGKAFRLEDGEGNPVKGEISWPADDKLRYTSVEYIQPGKPYYAAISEDAVSSLGLNLREPYQFDITIPTELEVVQAFPADGTEGVTADSVITVVFNRPVAPLVIAEERKTLPSPIQISPEVEGTGEWVNTSVYVFTPVEALAGATAYAVTVTAGLEDADGQSSLAEDFRWEFITATPGIQSFWLTDQPWNPDPSAGERNIRLDQGITVEFRQPMDIESTLSALSLQTEDGSPAELETTWSEDQRTLEIVPNGLLEYDTRYRLIITTDALAQGGGSIDEEFYWDFYTYPHPVVTGSRPVNGGVDTDAFREFSLYFSTPMRLASVREKVQFDPPLEEGVDWYSYTWDTDQFTIYGLEPSTNYTVTVFPGIEDIFGTPTTEGATIRFRTAALRPSAYLRMPQETPVLYRQGMAQDLYVSCRNVSQVNLGLSRLEPETYASMQNWDSGVRSYEYRHPSSLLWSLTDNCSGNVDQSVTHRHTLSLEDGSPLEPGFYFLSLDSPSIANTYSPYDDFQILLVASANVTFKTTSTGGLAWVTDLTSGQPLANVSLAVHDKNYEILDQATTDEYGLAEFTWELDTKSNVWDKRYFIETESEEVYGFASSEWGSGVSPYDLGIWVDSYNQPDRPVGYVYTDRPLYRPGQTVYFKGILRLDDDLKFSLPESGSANKARVVISSFEEEVQSFDMALSEFGTFSGEFAIAEAAALGEYFINVFYQDDENAVGSVGFGVADYRKADFQMDLSVEPKDVLPEDEFTATGQVEYYSGGPVIFADTTWTLQATTYTFVPPDLYSAYSFTNTERDAGYYEYDFYSQDAGGYIADGKTQTDENGAFEIPFTASLTDQGKSQVYTVEAAVTDFASNVVAGRDTVVVHRSAVYPGVRAQAYVGEAGKEQVFEIVALDWNGEVLPGQVVDVEIVERRWYSIQEQSADGRLTWSSSVEEIPVTKFDNLVVDENGKTEVTFVPPNGGVYLARVTAQDERGNEGVAAGYMWVAGDGYIPWRQSNDRSFDLITDRTDYVPGDTAEVLIASPFPGENYALLTVERGHVRHYEVLRLESSSTIYKLPITAEMAPNTYISVLILRGAGEDHAPDFRYGLTEIWVDKSAYEVQVEVTPDRTQAAPGESVNYAVRTLDAEGNPVSAEVSLGLSDLAALALRNPNSVPILDYFYAERGLGVWTSVPLVYSIEEYNAELALDEDLNPQGGGQGSGGGKGLGDEGVIKVRGYFPDTAYWAADLVTDEAGDASVTITLPDNLTIWRMDARAVTMETKVGQSLTDISSTRPLLVRPLTPRFFVTGDRVTLGAAVHNNTGEDLRVTVSLDATGLELVDSKAAQDVTIPDGQQALVNWQVSIPQDSTRVDLVFTAIGGAYSDASLPPLGTLEGQGLPVYRYEMPETVGASGMLLEEDTLVESIRLPQEWEVTQGKLTVNLAPSLAASMTDGLDYLEHYPYECVEQTVSRFLPNVLSTQALKAAGLSSPELEADLEEQVGVALQRLIANQNVDGGWGWWGKGKSDPTTSAYVMLGLVEAREAGFEIPTGVVTNGLRFLNARLTSLTVATEDWKVNRQAFLLYVLARAGKPAVSHTVLFYDLRDRLAIYARAYLAETLYRIDPQDERVQVLVSDLSSAALISATGTHWEEPERDYYNWNTDTRTTAIVLGALSLIDTENILNANAVRWLMNHRTNGYWQSTQETAWTLMGLTRWMVASGELEADFNYALALNGEQLGSWQAEADTLREIQTLQVDVTELLADESNRLAVARDEGAGSLYYTAHLNLWLPVEQVGALDQGITVAREYFLYDDPSQPVTQAEQGDLVLVRLTVANPGALHYLVVNDPLPAGLEAVDDSLKTSPTPIIPKEFQWDQIGREGWGWWYFEHVELRDEGVVLSASYLPAGTYVYTYLARASTVGEFQVIPTTAQEFYFPEVYGRAAGSVFTVTP
jgi:alpha-2-macroglobulin